MKKINPSRLRYRLQFGHFQVKTTNTGVNINGNFVVDKEVWGGLYTNSMAQQYLLMGQKVSDTKSFIVRHNEQLQDYPVLKFQEKYYSNLSFNEDTGDSHCSFDVIIGKKVTKRG